MLAQPIINNAVKKASSFSGEKALFLFSPIFKPYKRFLLFNEDYHSELEKVALIEYL